MDFVSELVPNSGLTDPLRHCPLIRFSWPSTRATDAAGHDARSPRRHGDDAGGDARPNPLSRPLILVLRRRGRLGPSWRPDRDIVLPS